MSAWKFRLAEPSDAAAFSKWAAENTQIDPADLMSAMKANNPTVVFFAAERDGVVVAFAPLYCQMQLAHLGFNPEIQGKDRLKALEVLIDGATAFAYQFGVREITTLTKDSYAMGEWAAKHGFEKDERSIYKLDINKILAEEAAKVVKTEA